MEGVYDLDQPLTDQDQGDMDPAGVVNCLRAFPGRGIRVWGAHTVNGHQDWRYVNVRRLFLTFARWLNAEMLDIIYEPNDRFLYARIRRELTNYLEKLFRAGALKGGAPEEAYYVRCDQTTTPDYIREMGRVIAEVGMAPAVPAEFIVVRVAYGAGQVDIQRAEGPLKGEETDGNG
jgi:phage tail sheath protein FI